MEYAPQPALSVSELNRRAKTLLETQLNQIWVEGEISNFSKPSSGHWYFSLKDNSAQIKCAMFRNRNLILTFTPKSGEKVRVRGRVSLYEPRGDYQLIAESMTLDGEGFLQKQFEELKIKLSKEGLFDQAHKKPLPKYVQHIAVISSSSGAALHDILNVLNRRNPNIQVTLIPSSVQGEGASEQLIACLKKAEQLEHVDAIIIGRGGGSLEDLWAFNDEALARKIHACPIPIVSAVGHEIDFSISDFVADARAPTPSAAAEILSDDVRALLEHIYVLNTHIVRSMKRRLSTFQTHLSNQRGRLKHPGEKITHWQQRTDICEQRIQNAIVVRLKKHQVRISHARKNIQSFKPNRAILNAHKQLSKLERQLILAIKHKIDKYQHHLGASASALDIVSPLSTLKRGYAIAKNDQGKIIKSVQDLNKGDRLSVLVSDGEITSKIDNIHKQTSKKDEK